MMQQNGAVCLGLVGFDGVMFKRKLWVVGGLAVRLTQGLPDERFLSSKSGLKGFLWRSTYWVAC